MDADATIAELDRDQSLRLLAGHDIGRLVVIEEHRPLVFPVNYVLDGEAVVIRTGTGTKLYGTTRSSVSFEVDDLDRATRTGWSVVLTGVAQEVTDLDRPDLVGRLPRYLHRAVGAGGTSRRCCAWHRQQSRAAASPGPKEDWPTVHPRARLSSGTSPRAAPLPPVVSQASRRGCA